MGGLGWVAVFMGGTRCVHTGVASGPTKKHQSVLGQGRSVGLRYHGAGDTETKAREGDSEGRAGDTQVRLGPGSVRGSVWCLQWKGWSESVWPDQNRHTQRIGGLNR